MNSLKVKNLYYSLFIIFLSTISLSGQNEDWFLLHGASVNGANVQSIYENNLIANPKNKVIVAVLDGGVDADHEDLKNVMWKNPGEVAGNNKDDDNNGYIDDIYGWNFIGNASGENVNHDTYEITRQYVSLKKKYEDVNPLNLGKKEKKEYAKYLTYKKKVESEYEKSKKDYENLAQQKSFIENFLNMAHATVGNEMAINSNSISKLEEEKDNINLQVIGVLKNILESTGKSFKNFEELENFILDDINQGEKYYESKYKYGYNPEFDPRSIVNDNFEDKNEKYYGNNDIAGPDAFHGTHVAGIIGAENNNMIGMDGVSNQVEIMGVRVVPDGDERDKDVANGIRYAVDNGAKIINMSFGKGISPAKKVVDDAVKYAAKKDVLLVHAAGNESSDTDTSANFPTDQYDRNGFFGKIFGKKQARNWIEVGALSRVKDENSVATFSNYGQINVDIFAPGHNIYSTAPDNNYKNSSGTSMAAPVVAGVAAIIRANFPSLSAEEVKEILMVSSDPIKEKVIQPGTEDMVNFSKLSVSGGILNAEKAYKLAASRAKGNS
ncbi:S8 family serine peptidase [Membranihabitans maritimus]|uniref:S8 family serine peptidase n=1 Tax=Membranihabitans maritimus TaxID=2904244 RepID=UPI001F02016A|nr:S8 family serine peptidase [Membranihabitans maritimus]